MRGRARSTPVFPTLVFLCALFVFLKLMVLPVQGAHSAPRPIEVVDLHVDLPFQHNYRGRPFLQGTGQFVASAAHRANVVGVVLPLYVPKDVSPQGPRLEDLESSYARVERALAAGGPYARPGCSGDAGRIRTFYSFEGAGPLAGASQASVAEWVTRGVRVFGLVHAFDNELATSSTGRSRGRTGLTDAGRRLVEAIHAEQAVVDVSHASDAAAREVVELAQRARRPVVATHSNARAVADHPRNLPDDLIKAIADTGGVIGANFHGPYLARDRRASLADVVAHIEHLVKVAGLDHVAIGSDFEGGIRPPEGMRDVEGYQELAEALLLKGWARADVAKIFAANALRVLCPP